MENNAAGTRISKSLSRKSSAPNDPDCVGCELLTVLVVMVAGARVFPKAGVSVLVLEVGESNAGRARRATPANPHIVM